MSFIEIKNEYLPWVLTLAFKEFQTTVLKQPQTADNSRCLPSTHSSLMRSWWMFQHGCVSPPILRHDEVHRHQFGTWNSCVQVLIVKRGDRINFFIFFPLLLFQKVFWNKKWFRWTGKTGQRWIWKMESQYLLFFYKNTAFVLDLYKLFMIICSFPT